MIPIVWVLAVAPGFLSGENSNVTCSDGLDNDGNGFIDCLDFSCQADPDGSDPTRTGVAVCESGETDGVYSGFFSNWACSDGLDNDGDGKVDCEDPECNGPETNVVCDGTTPAAGLSGLAGTQEMPERVDADADRAFIAAEVKVACTNGNDDDDTPNGFIDCGDNACRRSFEVNVCENATERGNAACSDGVDNDMDGKTDCDDSGCAKFDGATRTGSQEGIVVCDKDGFVSKYGTPGSVNISMITDDANAVCSDKLNNDDDMSSSGTPYIDCGDDNSFGDSGCTNDPLITVCESNDTKCADGIDNDGNGYEDCDDFNCKNSSNVTVCPSETGFDACSDGMDNDMPGDFGRNYVDCKDRSCNPCQDRDEWKMSDGKWRCDDFSRVEPVCLW